MNDFTKNMAQAIFNQDKINDLLRKELQQAVNDLLEAELTAFLGYDPYARAGWNTGIHAMVLTFARLIRNLAQLKCKCLGIATVNFISTRCLTTSSTPMSWKA